MAVDVPELTPIVSCTGSIDESDRKCDPFPVPELAPIEPGSDWIEPFVWPRHPVPGQVPELDTAIWADVPSDYREPVGGAHDPTFGIDAVPVPITPAPTVWDPHPGKPLTWTDQAEEHAWEQPETGTQCVAELGDEYQADTEPAPSRHRHARRDARQRTRLITISTWVRNIGALLILFAAWQLWGTTIAEHHSQDVLRQQFAAKVHVHPVAAGFTLAPASIRAPQPADGTPVGIIQIPKIGVNQVVVSGTDENDLNLGPGHYIGTAMPGQGGNVAIAGHRTTHGAPFNRLAELAPGDTIYLTDLAGQRMTYIVAVPPNPVSPSDVSVLNYFGDNRLTLTTCNPEFSASQRLIVVAEYQPPGSGRPAIPVSNIRGLPYKVTMSGEAGWNTSKFPIVLLEVGLLVALGLTNRRWSRILGREGRWLVLVPIWAAVLFIVFQTLTTFLPASA